MNSPRWLFTFASVSLVAAFTLLAGLLYAIQLARQPDFPQRVGDPSIEVQDTAFQSRDRDCQIVVYGDSTASIGIDPRILASETGLAACNLGVTRPVVDLLGTLPLDDFLKHNPAPQFIVLHLGPDIFYHRPSTVWGDNSTFNALALLARDVPLSATLKQMLRDPGEATRFEIFVLQGHFTPRAINEKDRETYLKRIQIYNHGAGPFVLDLPPQSACDATHLPLYGPVDTAWIKQLRSRYQTLGIKVIVSVSPIPECDPTRDRFQRDLNPLADVTTVTLPIDNFLPGDRHLSPAGSRVESQRIANVIRSFQTTAP